MLWASLLMQWIRICLPMQGTQVQSLVWEDPTHRGITNLYRTTTEPVLQKPEAAATKARAPRSPCSRQENHHTEKPTQLGRGRGSLPPAEKPTQQ